MFSPRILSASSLLAVRRMMGILLPSRSRAVARIPSSSGIIMSIRIRWTSFRSTAWMASKPLYALSVR